jgi:protein gp37
VNLSTGCDGCELWKLIPKLKRATGPCYAGILHEGRLAKAMPGLYASIFTEVRTAPGRMVEAASWGDLTGMRRPDKPWLNGMPRMIFVGDMGDALSQAIPFEYLDQEMIRSCKSPKGKRHLYLLLTKQAQRLKGLAEWLKERGERWPDNLWAGVSVTSRKTLNRLDWLVSAPVSHRFASLEPLWEAVDLTPWFPALDLVIIGGQSNQGEHQAPPFDLQWARDTIRQCRAAGVPVHVKQLGSFPILTGTCDDISLNMDGQLRVSPCPDLGGFRVHLKDSHGGEMAEWPEDLRVRETPAFTLPTPRTLF